MKLNDALPRDRRSTPRRYEVRADGELLHCDAGDACCRSRSATPCSDRCVSDAGSSSGSSSTRRSRPAAFAHSRRPRGGVAARRGRRAGDARSAFLEAPSGRPAQRRAAVRRRRVRRARRGSASSTRSHDAFLRTRVANRASRVQGRALLGDARRGVSAVAGAGALEAAVGGRLRAPRAGLRRVARARSASPRDDAQRLRPATAPRAACSRRPSGSASSAATRRSGCRPAVAPCARRASLARCARPRRATTWRRPRRSSTCSQAAHDRLYSRLFQS